MRRSVSEVRYCRQVTQFSQQRYVGGVLTFTFLYLVISLVVGGSTVGFLQEPELELVVLS